MATGANRLSNLTNPSVHSQLSNFGFHQAQELTFLGPANTDRVRGAALCRTRYSFSDPNSQSVGSVDVRNYKSLHLTPSVIASRFQLAWKVSAAPQSASAILRPTRCLTQDIRCLIPDVRADTSSLEMNLPGRETNIVTQANYPHSLIRDRLIGHACTNVETAEETSCTV